MKQLSDQEKRDFVNSCPTKVFAYDEENVEIEDAEKCTFCKECKKKAESLGKSDLVSVREIQDRFLFTVEVRIFLKLSVSDSLQELFDLKKS